MASKNRRYGEVSEFEASCPKIETEITSYAIGIDGKECEILNLGLLNKPLKPEPRGTELRSSYTALQDASVSFKEMSSIKGLVQSEVPNSFLIFDQEAKIYSVQYYLDPHSLI